MSLSWWCWELLRYYPKRFLLSKHLLAAIFQCQDTTSIQQTKKLDFIYRTQNGFNPFLTEHFKLHRPVFLQEISPIFVFTGKYLSEALIHQLTHIRTKDCSLNYEFSKSWVHKLFWMLKKQTICVHNMFWPCNFHVLNS